MVYVCKFSEDEIVGVLREHEAGAEVGELCRRHAISVRTFYRWKAEHGRVPPSLTVRLNELEEENRRLRALLVEAMLNASPSATRADGGAQALSARAVAPQEKTLLAARATR
jgi:putative transposase